jgi:hypothetical protein
MKKLKSISQGSGIKKIIMIALFFVILVLIFWFIIGWINIQFIKNIFNNVVNNIVNISGISPYLVKGLVIIISIPLLWAFFEVTKLNLKLFKKEKPQRKIALFVIIFYLGIFFLFMYILSRGSYFGLDGEPKRWYAETPEGIVLYESGGNDPIYNIKLQPVTYEIVRLYKRQEKGMGPKRIRISEEIEFFDPIRGKPKFFYFIDPKGNYEFYDQSGFHPVYSEKLKPATQEIVNAYLNRMEELKKKELEVRKKEEESQKEEELKRELYEKKAKLERELFEREEFKKLIAEEKKVDNKKIEYRWEKKIKGKNINIIYTKTTWQIAAKVVNRLQRLGAVVYYEYLSIESNIKNGAYLYYSNNDLEVALAIQASIIDILDINLNSVGKNAQITFEIH